jgi:hypothetical protein
MEMVWLIVVLDFRFLLESLLDPVPATFTSLSLRAKTRLPFA